MKHLLTLLAVAFAFTMNAQTECCNGGTAQLDAGAGFSAYAWSGGGGTAQTADYTTAGTYMVTVTDAVTGCTAVASHTVTFCPALTAATSSTDNTSCIAPFDGTATATPSGGCTGGYTYNWDTTPAQTTATATGLQGGTYSVTITTMSASGAICDLVETVTVNDTTNPPTVNINGSCN